MDRIFDSHFHLLFKHFVGRKKGKQPFTLDELIRTNGLAEIMNDLFGGPFDSQSSPAQVAQSQLHLGMTSILSVEHAFAVRILHIFGMNLSSVLPLDFDMMTKTRESKTTYWDEFNRQLTYHLDNEEMLGSNYNIHFLNRADFAGLDPAQIAEKLVLSPGRYFALTIEGGHNLSDVPIRSSEQKSLHPERQLKELQGRTDCDFLSINLCHLSEIPEQRLGGFAQGNNRLSQLAFRSDDFMPKVGLGLSDSGKRVIDQAYTHPKPVLIDIKHMSLYTRLEFYRYRAKLIIRKPEVERLPIISSHSGFTFLTTAEYIKEKRFKSTTNVAGDVMIDSRVHPENRKIGRTDDLINQGLYCNPWSINLFDDEIVEIMASGGIIGISLDQRILGAVGMAVDSVRDGYYEPEYVATREWEKLFIKYSLPGAERAEPLEELVPTRAERHMMLFCLHIVHAVRVGLDELGLRDDFSPWKHLCIGSDFDGMINPINGFDTVKDLGKLKGQLKKYLPLADKYLLPRQHIKALQYADDGRVVESFLNEAIDDFLYYNGVRFISQFLNNWDDDRVVIGKAIEVAEGADLAAGN